jgi:hypothetical protein
LLFKHLTNIKVTIPRPFFANFMILARFFNKQLLILDLRQNYEANYSAFDEKLFVESLGKLESLTQLKMDVDSFFNLDLESLATTAKSSPQTNFYQSDIKSCGIWENLKNCEVWSC